jgi:hypothetical protein
LCAGEKFWLRGRGGSLIGSVMKMRSILPGVAILAALTFHPQPALADEDAELNDQPAALQKTAREQIGAAKIEEVEPTYEEGQHATEVEYRENGKKMAIVIAPDGTLIQKEYRMAPGDAPEVIKSAVAAHFPGGRISHLKEVERGGGKFYEVSVKADGKSHQLQLDETGTPVK